MRVIATSPSARGSVKIRHSQQMEIIQNKNKNNSTTKYPKSRLRYCDAAKKVRFQMPPKLETIEQKPDTSIAEYKLALKAPAATCTAGCELKSMWTYRVNNKVVVF